MHSHTFSMAQIQHFLRPGSENQTSKKHKSTFLFIPPAFYIHMKIIGQMSFLQKVTLVHYITLHYSSGNSFILGFSNLVCNKQATH